MKVPHKRKLKDSGAAAVSQIVSLLGTMYGKKLKAKPKKHRVKIITAATKGRQQPLSFILGSCFSCIKLKINNAKQIAGNVNINKVFGQANHFS